MREGARHRQTARDFEQRENWRRAIEAYELAMDADRKARREIDPALYNRVGDLYRRIGDVNKAVHYYDRAVEGHLKAGFYNNAIALCNKILRNQPNRHSAYLKLGKIGAAKGFLSDARRHFLEYADRMHRSDRLDEAFSALIEFANLSPDPEIRLMVVDQLLEHNRRGSAVEQLRLAWRDLMQTGREPEARDVRKRIIAMAPQRDPEVDPPEAGDVVSPDIDGIVELPEILPYEDSEKGSEPAARSSTKDYERLIQNTRAETLADAGTDLDGGLDFDEGPDLDSATIDVDADGLDLETAQFAADEELEPDPEVIELELNTLPGAGSAYGIEEGAELEELEIERTALASEDEDRGSDTAIAPEPGLESANAYQGGDAATEPEEGSDEADRVRLQAAADDALAGDVESRVAGPLDGRAGAAKQGQFVRPVRAEGVLEPSAAETERRVTPQARVRQLEARFETERAPMVLVELADALLEAGEQEQATRRLREALDLYQEEGRLDEARRVAEELVRLDVNDVSSYQKNVELALMARDRKGLIAAYLALADCLDRVDSTEKARIVYARVLELDRGNQRALGALELLGKAHQVEQPSTSAVQAAARQEPVGEYVDLHSLVVEEEKARAKTTRFRIPAADPQSEADVNFAEMLKQFKSMVADAIEKEDATSHYDLGLAYRDMGLIDEAIAEFQISARNPDYRLRAIEMLGACFSEKGDHRIAVKVLARALQVAGHKDEELIEIFYAMGQAYEALGETDHALEWYERVIGCDVRFKDASQRVSMLRQ